MNGNENREQMEVTAQTVATEIENGANQTEISLGKFKDVNSLLKAYNSLEAEFTKRCQRIKELEGAVKFDKAENPAPTETDGNTECEKDTKKTETKETEILKEYLKGVLGAKQQAVILGLEGVGVKTPAQKPTTIEQAGMLAKQIF